MSQPQTSNQAKNSRTKKVPANSQQVYIRRSKNSAYVIEYHRQKCIGIGVCAQIAPNTFTMDAENKAEFVELPETEDSDAEILAAAQSCPVFAIVIKDAKTGLQIFPPLT